MAFFDDAQVGKISIRQMVFHLVGPEAKDLVLLQALDPGRYASFFIERILSVNAGLPYVFSDASATRTRLARIVDDGSAFQKQSEQLAEDFQRHHGGSAARGAFLVFDIDANGQQCFALLKYDDETVLSYEFEEDAQGRKRVSLEALERTFVQNREALQKSALVRLDDQAGELVVLDRRNQQKVARYFESFLGAVRAYEDADLTARLVKVTRDVIRENPDLVPEEVYREMTRRTYDAAAAGGEVAVDEQASFLDTVVGRKLPLENPLVAKFGQALKRARIDAIPVKLDAATVGRPATIRYITENRIQIRVPEEMKRAIEVKEDRIIVHDRLKTEYDEPGPAPSSQGAEARRSGPAQPTRH